MSFTGIYELESQENHVEFLEAIDLLKAKRTGNVITKIEQDGNNFKWIESTANHTWPNTFTVGQECEMTTMGGDKFKTLIIMENGQLKIQFPHSHLTAEMVDDKLVQIVVTSGENAVTWKRVFRRLGDCMSQHVLEKEA
ncbi:gastrotropin-like [Periophthalmus magnuspinnatus]|uniref:gastrotropin-like n=1 Tax=Periophthalmus magnuspinnatus TaxID=409849 RepID=UPI00145A0ED8|nr:gastrotropin-like [Periophthalmus magnuspinnatus]